MKDKIINFICHCNNYFYVENELRMIIPCEHFVHEKCIDDKRVCKICNKKIEKIIDNNKILSSRKYIKNRVDLRSVVLENTNFGNYLYIPNAILKFTNLMNKVLLINNERDVLSIMLYFQSITNIKFKIIDNTKKNKIRLENNVIRWINEEDEKINKIIISNHHHFLDSYVLYYLFRCGFLSSEFINTTDIGRIISKTCDLLIFRRGKDTNTVEKIKEYLKRRNRVSIFPEGTISNHKTLIKFRTGAFYVGAPICPIIIKYEPFISDIEIPKTIIKLLMSNEIVVSVYINDLEYPPFTNENIEKIRSKMAKLGNLEMARTSNKFIKD
jgi:1-acyl-sn-glycerol-3-phosphate acyltransferase